MDITSCLYNKNKYTCSEIICGFHCFHAVLANTVANSATVVSYASKRLKTLAHGLKIFISSLHAHCITCIHWLQ
jgi:hypothetical protein